MKTFKTFLKESDNDTTEPDRSDRFIWKPEHIKINDPSKVKPSSWKEVLDSIIKGQNHPDNLREKTYQEPENAERQSLPDHPMMPDNTVLYNKKEFDRDLETYMEFHKKPEYMQFEEHHNNLSKKHLEMIKSYKGWSADINDFLRTGTLSGAEISDIKKKSLNADAEKLDKITSLELKHPITVYRGAKELHNIDKLNPGDKFTDKAFVSTSLNHQVANQFGNTRPNKIYDGEKEIDGVGWHKALFQINLKPGDKAHHLDNPNFYKGDINHHNYMNENEVLLPRNTTFRVVKHEKIINPENPHGTEKYKRTHYHVVHLEVHKE